MECGKNDFTDRSVFDDRCRAKGKATLKKMPLRRVFTRPRLVAAVRVRTRKFLVGSTADVYDRGKTAIATHESNTSYLPFD
jgi:hypothetical protein